MSSVDISLTEEYRDGMSFGTAAIISLILAFIIVGIGYIGSKNAPQDEDEKMSPGETVIGVVGVAILLAGGLFIAMVFFSGDASRF